MMRGQPTRLSWPDLAAASLPGGTARICVSGYLHPVEPEGPHSYFVLGPEPPCCFGCLPRDPLQAIEVFIAEPVAACIGALLLTGELRRLHDDPGGWRYQLIATSAVSEPPRARSFPRRAILAAGPLLCMAATPRTASAQAIDETTGRQVIADQPTIDLHSHAGGLSGVRGVDENRPFRPVADPMRDGGMAVTCLAVVSDAPTHRVGPDRRIHPFREPDPGELYQFGIRAFARAHALAKAQNLQIITTAAQLLAARSTTPSAIIAAEGADFLEGRVERIDEAHARWQLRHLQLTHYRPNELGDIQTESPRHGGLTDVGADVIRRCNRIGIVVDVAHGTYDLVKRAAAVTTKPLVLSHTALTRAPRPFTRLITPDHARLVAGTGGVIGIWPPAASFPTLAAMAAGMARMVDVVGIDHVGLGSDMLGLVGPSIFPTYDATTPLSAALLAHGFRADEVRKLLGGNYARVFVQTV